MSESIFIENANFTKTVGILRPSPYNLFDRFDGGIHTPWVKASLFQDLAMQVPVAADGDPVRVIADRSGNDYHYVAPSDARRGIYREADGVFAGIDCSGSKGYSLSGDALGVLSGVGNALVCLAVNLDAITTYRSVFRINNESNTERLALGTKGSAAQLELISRRAVGETAAAVYVARPTGTHIYSSVANYAAGTNAQYIDHNAASGVGSGSVPGNTSGGVANGAFLGHYAEGSSFANMRFYGGVILAGAASVEAVRLEVEQYFADSVGVALVL